MLQAECVTRCGASRSMVFVKTTPTVTSRHGHLFDDATAWVNAHVVLPVVKPKQLLLLLLDLYAHSSSHRNGSRAEVESKN